MNQDSTSETRIRLRDRQRLEAQAAILAAAERVFVEDGIAGARMESIAARAGVAVGTLYNYFEDREGLLTALVEERRAALLRKLDLALEGARRKPFEESLAAFLGAFFDHWASHRGLLALLVQADGAASAGRGKQHLLDEVTRRAEAVLRRGRSQGKVQADASGLQADFLVGMVRGALRTDAGKAREREEDRAGQILEAFLRGSGT